MARISYKSEATNFHDEQIPVLAGYTSDVSLKDEAPDATIASTSESVLWRPYVIYFRSECMSQPMSADQELVSDVVACQLVIKQILDVLDVIAPVEVREKMSSQLKNIDFSTHPAAADPVTLRAIQKAIALIELKFTPQGEAH